jgi:hypothetical protein
MGRRRAAEPPYETLSAAAAMSYESRPSSPSREEVSSMEDAKEFWTELSQDDIRNADIPEIDD